MRLAQYANDLVAWAPAKVNLFLEVLGKRPDGYHEIATLMVAIGLYDTLVFKEEPTGRLLLGCNRPDLSTGPDNLVLRAASLLRERTGCSQGARIRLVKRIPLAAGLAGGSSDAAATLAGLNELWRLGLSVAELARLAGEVGSDVAFFFHTPAAWCTGRGEIVTPVSLPRPLHLVLVCPKFGCSTAEVYGNVTVPAKAHSGDEIRRALEDGDPDEIGRRLFNRLQPAATKVAPDIANHVARLARTGAAGQLMSGSGSTLFALCRDRSEAERVASSLRQGMEGSVYLVRSCA